MSWNLAGTNAALRRKLMNLLVRRWPVAGARHGDSAAPEVACRHLLPFAHLSGHRR